jgi:hypothetical protein
MDNFCIVPLLHSASGMVSADGEVCMPKEMQVQASQRSALPLTTFQLSIQMTISYKRHINIKSNLGNTVRISGQNKHTQQHNLINQATSFGLFRAIIRPYLFRNYQ